MSDNDNGPVWHEWPMRMWADLTTVGEKDQGLMREELLTARDLYRSALPDVEAIFEYLDDGDNNLGDLDAGVTALDIVKLWQRRRHADYESWSDRADAWIGTEGAVLLRYLRGVATSQEDAVLDELKAKLGQALAGDESAEFHYIDRTTSGGGITCLERNDQ